MLRRSIVFVSTSARPQRVVRQQRVAKRRQIERKISSCRRHVEDTENDSEDESDLGENSWDAFNLSVTLLCFHLTMSSGSVPLFAAMMNTSIGDLTTSQLAWMGLSQSVIQIAGIKTIADRFAENDDGLALSVRFRLDRRTLMISVIAAAVVDLIDTQLSHWLPPSEPSLSEILVGQRDDPVAAAVVAVMAVCVGPVLEEYLYRGLLLPRLLTFYPLNISLLVNASMFAIEHFSLMAFPQHFVCGVVSGVAYVESNGNLAAAILVHGLVNAIAVIERVSICTTKHIRRPTCAMLHDICILVAFRVTILSTNRCHLASIRRRAVNHSKRS